VTHARNRVEAAYGFGLPKDGRFDGKQDEVRRWVAIGSMNHLPMIGFFLDHGHNAVLEKGIFNG